MTTDDPGAAADDAGSPEFASAEDHRLFELLDGYLGSLHAGDLGSRSVTAERNPDLLKWLRCLELLDRLAPGTTGSTGVEAVDGAEPPLLPFGKYELEEEVGRGGMGVVFRARQTDLDRIVAIKMILSSRLASADDIRRFHAESRAAGSLRHPNIVAIHEAGEVHGQHFFAMDFVEGPSLAQALAGGPFDPRQAAECTTAISRAVQYLHEHNIIHRDLKPSNILLAADGTPHVTDFGLAKALGADSGHTQSGAIVGTPSYMAPEQAAGASAEISARSDIYSLGAILFELLTGRPPFSNPSPIDTILQVIEGEPPRPRQINPSVPVALEWICLKCLERDPRNRYASAAELAEDLDRFLRGEVPSVGPPGLLRSLVRWGRQQPALAAHLGAISLAALIIQVTYMSVGHDRPFHLMIMGLFAAWALCAALAQGILERTPRAGIIRYVWSAADAGFLGLILYVASDPLGPLLVGYPLMIVAAGLFFDVGLVSFMTAACLASYGLLLAVGRQPLAPPQYTLIYMTALGVIGLVVGYQAYRIRVLSRCFDDRR